MKKLLLLSLSGLFSCSLSFAQNVGIGTSTPNANALLHVDLGPSTNKGFLITGIADASATVPDLGPGNRMIFFPGKGAFRAGSVIVQEWDDFRVGKNSVAMGYSTIASGTASVAIGNGGIASGNGSVAMGSGATASGVGSIAFGSGSNASGTFSTAVGAYTKARGYASLVTGIYNDPILASAETSISPTTPLFIIGNGDYITSSNAFVVRKDGNVGIGENAPTSSLQIKTNSDFNAGNMHLHLVENEGSDFTRIRMSNTGNSNSWDFAARTNPSNNAAAELNYYYSGLGQNALSIKGNGNATLAGTLTQASDARLKKNINPVQDALPLLVKLNGYNYYWKNEKMDASLQYGVLAQEVQKIFPEMVKADDKGILSVNYSGLIPVMIESIKEQQKIIGDKQKQIDEINIRLQKIELLLSK